MSDILRALIYGLGKGVSRGASTFMGVSETNRRAAEDAERLQMALESHDLGMQGFEEAKLANAAQRKRDELEMEHKMVQQQREEEDRAAAKEAQKPDYWEALYDKYRAGLASEVEKDMVEGKLKIGKYATGKKLDEMTAFQQADIKLKKKKSVREEEKLGLEVLESERKGKEAAQKLRQYQDKMRGKARTETSTERDRVVSEIMSIVAPSAQAAGIGGYQKIGDEAIPKYPTEAQSKSFLLTKGQPGTITDPGVRKLGGIDWLAKDRPEEVANPLRPLYEKYQSLDPDSSWFQQKLGEKLQGLQDMDFAPAVESEFNESENKILNSPLLLEALETGVRIPWADIKKKFPDADIAKIKKMLGVK